MGWLKKSLKFTGDAFGGGFLRDSLGIGGEDPGSKQLAQILGVLNKAKGEGDIERAKAGVQLRRQIPIIQTAYKKQGENLRYLADATKKSVTDREPSNLARTAAGVGARGLGSSNLATLAARGVRGDTTRALSQIDQLFADRFGDLATREAGDLSDIARQEASLTSQGIGQNNSLYGSMADAYGNQQFEPKKDLWDIVGAAAPIIGTFAGLGGGGGSGYVGSSGLNIF